MDLFNQGVHNHLGNNSFLDIHGNGLSLQEMIDSDIKAEFDDFMGNNPLGFDSPMDSIELINDIDTTDSLFRTDIQPMTSMQTSTATNVIWGQTNSTSGLLDNFPPNLSSTSVFNNSEYLEDMNSASIVMVNPNNVMPISASNNQITHHQRNLPATATSTAAQVQMQQEQQAPVQQVIQRISVSNGQFSNVQSVPKVVAPAYVPQSQHQMAATSQAQGYKAVNGRAVKTVKVLPPMSSAVSSPMTQIPASPGGNNVVSTTTGTVATPSSQNSSNTNRKKSQNNQNQQEKENGFPKPAYSYSCLIALALKNSETGSMSVAEIYKFMCEHFPYFKTAPSGWKNSVRHNLSLNKCFEKIEKPATPGSNQRKGCLWTMNPAKKTKMDEEVQKWSRKDPMAIKKGMIQPHTLELLERGEMKKDYNANRRSTPKDADEEEDPRTPISVSSQGSQGYDSVASDFVDIDGIAPMPDSSLPELNFQQATGGIYEDLGEERLEFNQGSNGNLNVQVSNQDNIFYSASIQGNYTITRADSSSVTGPRLTSFVLQKPIEAQKILNGRDQY